MNRALFGRLVLSTAIFLSASAIGAQKGTAAKAGAEGKFEHIERNGSLAHPDATPTQITEKELNTYLASGTLEMPPGVESIRMEGDAGGLIGRARVDFDKVRSETKNPNPMLSLFTGVHDVVVTAQASGSGGKGTVLVDKVWFDGTEIPRFVVQMFVEKYLAPRYPGVGMESKFPLPNRIDSAVIGSHVLTVIQK